jgi:hypothetical protein
MIAWLFIDRGDEKVNSLGTEVLAELEQIVSGSSPKSLPAWC